MPVPDVVPEICLVLGAAAALVTALFVPRRAQWVAGVVALVSLAAAAATTVDLMATPARLTFSGTWALDASMWSKLVIIGAAALVVGLSPEWFRADARHGEYYALLLLATVGAVMMASAADVMELVVGVLLSSVTGYTLAAYHRDSALAVEAGMKFFLIGGLANPLLALGAVLLFGVAGTTVYDAMTLELASAQPIVLVTAAALVTVGIAFELGAVPAHAWMPDVAEGAPAPSAGFLTVVPKIGALLALARILSLLPEESVGWRPLVAGMAVATMTLGNLAALWQDDVRRLLGWSSVSQSGYGLLGVVAIGVSDLALPALLYFLVAYAAANLAAFGVVVELRGRTALADYAGIARRRPWLLAALGVAFLSLVGIPPLAGFTAKWTLFTAVIDAGYGWLAAVAVANTVVSLFYYLRVLAPAYLDESAGPVAVLGRLAAVPTFLAAAGVVGLGIAAEPLLRAFQNAVLLP